MSLSPKLPFFVSIPHSGEKVPSEVSWLLGLKEETLMRDVDRYVDVLYKPIIEKLDLTAIKTQWHRYVVDLNRKPDEFDQDAVMGASQKSGCQTKEIHWSQTTQKEVLIKTPMSIELHQQLVNQYYEPLHNSLKNIKKKIMGSFGVVYHLDLHSMPSKGTELHPDPGESRAEIVVSDQHGTSANSDFKDRVMEAFQKAGFQVGYNWPYIGGGITKTYGEPEKGIHTVQIELNRALYMNEETKKLSEEKLEKIQAQLGSAIEEIYHWVEKGSRESGD